MHPGTYVPGSPDEKPRSGPSILKCQSYANWLSYCSHSRSAR